MPLTTFTFMSGYVTIDHDFSQTKLSSACKVIHIIAQQKADFDRLDDYFRKLLGEDGFKETMSPPSHATVHQTWDGLFGGFTPPQGTDNVQPYMYQHRHFECTAPSSPNMKNRMELMKFLNKNGLKFTGDDLG